MHPLNQDTVIKRSTPFSLYLLIFLSSIIFFGSSALINDPSHLKNENRFVEDCVPPPPVDEIEYSLFYDSKMTDPSFEGLTEIHQTEFTLIDALLTSENASQNLIGTLISIVMGFQLDATAQQAYIWANNLDCERLRLCPASLELLNLQAQNNYFVHLSYMEQQFSIAASEMQALRAEINSLSGKTSYPLTNSIALLNQYLDLVDALNYTKFEIFRDFTGYCDLPQYALNGPFCSSTFAAMAFQRKKQGLAATEAIRRLQSIYDCNNKSGGSKKAGASEFGDKQESAAVTNLVVQPNPVKGGAVIKFNVKEDQLISIKIFNMKGKHVKTISEGFLLNGEQYFYWDKSTESGQTVQRGIYFCTLVMNKNVITKKFTVL